MNPYAATPSGPATQMAAPGLALRPSLPAPGLNSAPSIPLLGSTSQDLPQTGSNGALNGDIGAKRSFSEPVDDASKRMRLNTPTGRAPYSTHTADQRPGFVPPPATKSPLQLAAEKVAAAQAAGGTPSSSLPPPPHALGQGAAPEKLAHIVATEGEVFYVRWAVLESLKNSGQGQQSLDKPLGSEFNGIPVPRVQERYMARQGSPIDPRRFAHSNLKDVLQLVAGDLCDAHVNAQQKAVITVKPGLRIDETNMHGLAGGVGLRAAISALDFHWANAHSGAPPPSVTMANHHHGSASASGPHKTGSSESLPPPPDSAIMGVSQSLMSGKALATVPLAQPPVSQPAAGTGVNDDMTEDKSRRILLKMCRRMLLHLRFTMYKEGYRALGAQQNQIYGMRQSGAPRVALAAMSEVRGGPGGGTLATPAHTLVPQQPAAAAASIAGADMLSAIKQEYGINDEEQQSLMSGPTSFSNSNPNPNSNNLWPPADLVYPSDLLLSLANPIAPRVSQRVGDLRLIWQQGWPSVQCPVSSQLSSNLVLLTSLVELSEWVKDTCKEGMSPFHVTTQDGRRLEYGTLSAEEAREWGQVKQEVVMADGSTFHMEGGGSSAPETSRPVHWQFSPTSESARRALNGTMARVRAQLLPAGTATDEAVELAAGQCLVVPELGFLWDVRKVMDMWRFVHSVVAETAYAAAGDRIPLDIKGHSECPSPYPVARLRDDFRRMRGSALHLSPLGFGSLIDILSWGPFRHRFAIDAPVQKGESGFLYPLFNPLHDLRELIESRLEHLCTSEAEHARSSNLPPGFQPQLNPEDGYRMDQVKSDFKGFYGYELENVRLGFATLGQLMDSSDDLCTVHTVASTVLILPTNLTKLRLLLRRTFRGLSAPSFITPADVEARYAEMWGRPFPTTDSDGNGGVPGYLQDMGDLCTVQAHRVFPPLPDVESAGLKRLRGTVAHNLLKMREVKGAAARRYANQNSSAGMQGPPTRRPISVEGTSHGYSGSSGPRGGGGGGGGGQGRLPPHPSMRNASIPSSGTVVDSRPAPRETGRADGAAALDPLLAELAASAGLDPVILGMMAESMLADPSRAVAVDAAAGLLGDAAGSTGSGATGQQSLLAQGMLSLDSQARPEQKTGGIIQQLKQQAAKEQQQKAAAAAAALAQSMPSVLAAYPQAQAQAPAAAPAAAFGAQAAVPGMQAMSAHDVATQAAAAAAYYAELARTAAAAAAAGGSVPGVAPVQQPAAAAVAAPTYQQYYQAQAAAAGAAGAAAYPAANPAQAPAAQPAAAAAAAYPGAAGYYAQQYGSQQPYGYAAGAYPGHTAAAYGAAQGTQQQPPAATANAAQAAAQQQYQQYQHYQQHAQQQAQQQQGQVAAAKAAGAQTQAQGATAAKPAQQSQTAHQQASTQQQAANTQAKTQQPGQQQYSAAGPHQGASASQGPSANPSSNAAAGAAQAQGATQATAAAGQGAAAQAGKPAATGATFSGAAASGAAGARPAGAAAAAAVRPAGAQAGAARPAAQQTQASQYPQYAYGAQQGYGQQAGSYPQQQHQQPAAAQYGAAAHAQQPASGAPQTGGYGSYPGAQPAAAGQAPGAAAYPGYSTAQHTAQPSHAAAAPYSGYQGAPAAQPAAGAYPGAYPSAAGYPPAGTAAPAAGAQPAAAQHGAYGQYGYAQSYPGYPQQTAAAAAPAGTAAAPPWAAGTAAAQPAPGAAAGAQPAAASATDPYAAYQQQWAAYYAAQGASAAAAPAQPAYGQADPQAYAQYMQAYGAHQQAQQAAQQHPSAAGGYAYPAQGSWPAAHGHHPTG